MYLKSVLIDFAKLHHQLTFESIVKLLSSRKQLRSLLLSCCKKVTTKRIVLSSA